MNLPREVDHLQSGDAAAVGFGVPEICPNFYPRDDFYLLSPSLRLDDTTEFIERITAMKQIQTTGSADYHHKHIESQNGSASLRGTKETPIDEHSEPSDGKSWRQRHKCGICGTVQSNSSECYNCQKSRLIIEMATHRVSSQDAIADESPRSVDGYVKPTCSMLGRSNRSETTTRKIHRDGLNRVGLSLTKESWTPNVIMPPNPKPFPTSKPRLNSGHLGSVHGSSWKCIKCQQKNGASISSCVSCKWRKSGCGEEHIDHRSRSRKLKGGKGEATYDRNALALKHKYDAHELSRKCLTIACSGVLAGMVRRDPLGLFAEPVPANIEDYHKEIKDPIDCSALRQMIFSSKYSSLGSFIADARRLW